MIVVTGAAGFIGSNLVHALNARGERDLLLVDSFERGIKFRNLLGARFTDVIDKGELLPLLAREDVSLKNVRAVIHQGACSSTTEWNGKYLLENNYAYSKRLLHWCEDHRLPFLYASSAAVYGGGKVFREERELERPLNAYGWSKQIFDDYVRDREWLTQVVGLRYFNVYGPRESHKGSMASVALHLHRQLQTGSGVKLFQGTDGYADGGQERDFVHVDDVVLAILHFLDHPGQKGIFNVGTGRAEAFNEVASAVIAHRGRGGIEYIPFPEHLQGSYQSFTQADLTRLRQAGFTAPMRSVAEGVKQYLAWLDAHPES